MIYRTMTVSGLYGSNIEADSDEQAVQIAQGPGHYETVLDITEHNGEMVLVVAE